MRSINQEDWKSKGLKSKIASIPNKSRMAKNITGKNSG